MGTSVLLRLWLVVALALAGCTARPPMAPPPAGVQRPAEARPADVSVKGTITAPEGFRVTATTTQVVSSASVTLADRFGNAIAAGISDGSGGFTLAPSGFVPATNGIYLLEAAKSLNGAAPGAAMARFRTILTWSGSEWLSISNATGSVPIVLNPLTTAVALLSAIDPANVPSERTIGKVDAVADPAVLNSGGALTFTNHPDSELTALASDMVSYLGVDADPTAAVTGTTPVLSSLSASGGSPGDVVSLSGVGFVPLSGRNTVRFGTTAATVFLATPRLLIVQVPAGANGNVTVTTSYGTSNALAYSTEKVTLTVNPNGYSGSWAIPGVTSDWQREQRRVDLAPGSYNLQFNGFGTYGFTVSASGAVTVTSGPLTGGTRSLTFDTTTVTLNANGTQQQWYVDYVNTWRSGNHAMTLLRNTSYVAFINGSSTGVAFAVDGANNVSVTGSSATGGAGTLTLQCTDVAVNANGYQGNWTVSNSGVGWVSGNQTVRLVRSQQYSFWTYAADRSSGTAIPFTVGSTGTVTTTDTRASGGAGSLALVTSAVSINASGFVGSYTVANVTGWLSGNQTVTLLRDSAYELRWNFGGTSVTFNVGSTGTVTVNSPSATGGAAALTFVVQNVTINRGGFNAPWSLNSVTTYYSYPNNVVPLVKGQTYTLFPVSGNSGNPINFLLDASGTVTTFGQKATGGAAALTYNTVNVTINPNGFNPWTSYPTWNVEGYQEHYIGTRTIPLIRTGTHALGFRSIGLCVYFSVDNAGVVSSAATHTGGAQSLTLNVVTTTFTTGATANWYIANVMNSQIGSSTFTLLRGLNYTLTSGSYSQSFAINAAGQASPASFTVNGNSFTLSP